MTIEVIAEVRQGMPLQPSSVRVDIPESLIEKGEEVYRVADNSLDGFGTNAGDLLVVEPKSSANTAELVLVRKGGNVYVGRWWAKHGRRDVLDERNAEVIVTRPTILGSINLIVRGLHADHA